ncbi:ribonuclease P protein component [Hirschia litorea]|uniref:Ribonuclease P protein component n=1 Tax=Hirschia litorea TaxID=1199156 RepID=A0ABW2IK53_9PROT
MASEALNETIINRVERLRVRRAFLFVAQGYAERRRSVVVQARVRPPASPPEATDSSINNSVKTLSHPTKSDHFAGAGFTATKKIGGAVVRNRAKRRLREASTQLMHKHALAGVDYVFIARRDTTTREWPALLDDMESALISLRQKILSGAPPDPKPDRYRSPRKGKRAVSQKNKK